jgi:hypothetical protein
MLLKTSSAILVALSLCGCGMHFRYLHTDYPLGDKEAELAALQACSENIDPVTAETAHAKSTGLGYIIWAPLGPIYKLDDGCNAECDAAREKIKMVVHQCMEEKGWVYTARESYAKAVAED